MYELVTPPARKRPKNAPKTRLGSSREDDVASRDAQIVAKLGAWFAQSQRDLPFRRNRDPYAIWVSEIMLQQTQVSTVIPYFTRWMARFPSIETLAQADESEVLSLFQGLGYYSRGRNLHRAAQAICDQHGGSLPSDLTELRKLPGIGEYTAAAISSIAFEKAVPVVDGNVERVLCRLDAKRGDPKKRQLATELRARAARLIEHAVPSQHNQAMMELGALICTPKQPACAQCPVVAHCVGYGSNLASELPEATRRPKPEQRHVIVFFARRGTRIFLQKQPPTAVHWRGLHVLPYFEIAETAPRSKQETPHQVLSRLSKSAQLIATEPVDKFTYPITRFRFQAEVYPVSRVPSGTDHGQYYDVDELQSLAMPAPHRRCLERILRATF